MNTLLFSPMRTRWGTLAVLVCSLLGCATAERPAGPPASAAFAPDWRSHTYPLYMRGRGIAADVNSWWVPDNLPKGNYRVIERKGDDADLLDSPRLEVEPSAWKEVHLMIPISHMHVELLDERYVTPDTASPPK